MTDAALIRLDELHMMATKCDSEVDVPAIN